MRQVVVGGRLQCISSNHHDFPLVSGVKEKNAFSFILQKSSHLFLELLSALIGNH